MKVIALDIDGCLANFSKAYAHLLIKVGGDKLPSGWETNPDFPSVWYWERQAGYVDADEKAAWARIVDAKTKFWQNLEPLPGAVETLTMLNRRQKAGDQIWFISHRMGEKAHLQTLNWLYTYGIDFPCLFFAADKVPYLRALGTNFYIDDKPSTVEDLARISSEEKWPNFNLYLKQAPYNKTLWGTVKSAVSVKDALIAEGLWA